MFIDLHIHSTASDGTDTPESILEKICAADGVKIFSITDHENFNGVEKVLPLIPRDVFFINGAEISCKTAQGTRCHILTYFFDPAHEEMQKISRLGRELQKAKFDIRLKYLCELYGVTVTAEELAENFASESYGKPQLVNFLAPKLGFEKRKIYHDIKKCRVGGMRLDVTEVVKAVTAAGGIAVWAHPLGGEGERRILPEEFEERLEVLKACGICGLECYYSRYTPYETRFLVDAANKNNLLISGGSDYHGSNKTISLGELGTEFPTVKISQLTILQEVFARHKNLRVRKAFEVAKKSHAGQVDKSGVAYICHPVTVAFNCGGDDSAIITALLHDTVEDAGITFDELKNSIPLTDDELKALKLLTHDKSTPYLEYVERIKGNELARRVKIADLQHNADLSRIPAAQISDEDLNRVEKYKQALNILNS